VPLCVVGFAASREGHVLSDGGARPS